MKHVNRMLIGTLLLFAFLVNMASSALAYSYPGYKWQQGYAYYAIDSTIPIGWSLPIYYAQSSWNNAGSSFSFYSSGSTNNKLYYAGLGSNGATAVTYTTRSGSSITRNEI
jgi:hypothetical protein